MKNIKFLAIAFVALSMSFVSCSSDDDWNESLKETDILGTWQYYDQTLSIDGKVIFYGLIEHESSCEVDMLEFKEDNVFTILYFEEEEGECIEYSYEDAWKLDGQALYMYEVPGWGFDIEYKVSRKGNSLKMVEFYEVDESFIEYFEEDYGPTDHEFVIGEIVTFEGTLRKK